MASLIILTLFGLLANYGHCQFPGMPPMGGAGMLEGITPEMMMMMSAGGGGGGGGGGAFGGLDPAMLLASGGLGGGGGGGGGMNEIARMAMISNMFRQPEPAPAPQPTPSMPSTPAAVPPGQGNSLAKNIADMLGGGSPGVTVNPQQQGQLWGVVQMSQNSQRIFDAIQNINDRLELERIGLPQVPRMMSMTMCPLPQRCPMIMCEQTEMPYLPETFYVCQGCPRCVMDAGTRRNMMLYSDMANRGAPGGGNAGGGGGGNMMQQMMLAQAMGGGSGGNMNPAMLAALMAPPPPQPAPVQQPQPTPPAPGLMMNHAQMQAMFPRLTQPSPQPASPPNMPPNMPMIPPGFKLVRTDTPTGSAASVGASVSTKTTITKGKSKPPPPPPAGQFPKPPPEFVQAMKRMRQLGETMRGQRTGGQPAR